MKKNLLLSAVLLTCASAFARTTDASDINMGTPVVTSFEESIDPSEFKGIEISFPDNNLQQAIGTTDGWNYGAVALQVTEAYLYKLDAENNPDTENPLASVRTVESDYEAESVTVFNNPAVRAALEAGSKYMVTINNLILFDQFLWDTIWTAEDIITVTFSTNGTTEITDLECQNGNNSPAMFNLNGQRVSNAKGLVIINGKKVNLK